MQYRVITSGFPQFDWFHASGLAVLLAWVSQSPTILSKQANSYLLSNEMSDVPLCSTDVLSAVLALPYESDIATVQEDNLIPIAIANLDGLLAALFTMPGCRAVSVHDVIQRARISSSVVSQSLQKVKKKIERWQMWLDKNVHGSDKWLTELLCFYDVGNPQILTFSEGYGSTDITIPMSIEPTLSYAPRRPINGNLLDKATNVTTVGNCFASLLAFIGAARFLRAHRVDGRHVNYYTLLPSSLTVFPETTLPLLKSISQPPERAALVQGMKLLQTCKVLDPSGACLLYQVLQTQGASQSISFIRGSFCLEWFAMIEERLGKNIIHHWIELLHRSPDRLSVELDNLSDALIRKSVSSWMLHLHTLAQYNLHHPDRSAITYSLIDAKEMLKLMNTPNNLPLSTVLERKQGTLRFGHAFRQLGEYNHGELRDIVDQLANVQTVEQLLYVLTSALQACVVMQAKFPFAIIPNDNDFRLLVTDVQQLGARTVAHLLMVLPSLRYDSEATDSYSLSEISTPTVDD